MVCLSVTWEKQDSLSPQIRYDVWRRLLKKFWAVVVGYSMVVLIAIYMYQFRSVSRLFRQIMGMSEDGWVSVHLHVLPCKILLIKFIVLSVLGAFLCLMQHN